MPFAARLYWQSNLLEFVVRLEAGGHENPAGASEHKSKVSEEASKVRREQSMRDSAPGKQLAVTKARRPSSPWPSCA